MRTTIQKLFFNGEWKELLAVLNANNEKLNGELSFYKGISLTKLGSFDEALVSFRNVLEDKNTNIEYQLKSCKNMGIISHIKGDFEFSKNCAQECNSICEGKDEFANIWVELETYLNADNFETERVIELLSRINDKKTSKFVQSTVATYLNHHGKFEPSVAILEYLLSCNKSVLSNLYCTAFEHYRSKKQIDNMTQVLHHLMTHESLNAPVVLDYMQLCINLESQHELDACGQLAARIVAELRSQQVFASTTMLQVCGEVLRQSDTRDRVLVPSRYGIIGITPVVSALRERISRYARSASPVLVRGESGTGKELVAQALHDAGHRAAGPFIPVNCAAIPESVFESQLFGHVAGAFTGAAKDQPGLIELAGTGTLFLDEVGELPGAVQGKLLRFLENGEYRRLGAEQVLRSRARIVAATNRNLAEEPGFRPDLYHRLRRLEIEVPPLRDRQDDVRYLARHRIRQLNVHEGCGWKQLDLDAETLLEQLDYPGNVRELFNLVDHAWHEAVQPVGTAELWRAMRRLAAERDRAARLGRDLPSNPSTLQLEAGVRQATGPLKQLQEEVAVQAVRQAVAHFHGDVEKAATWLDVSRRSIYRYLERGRDLKTGETIST